jgi:hypothetical protein
MEITLYEFENSELLKYIVSEIPLNKHTPSNRIIIEKAMSGIELSDDEYRQMLELFLSLISLEQIESA